MFDQDSAEPDDIPPCEGGTKAKTHRQDGLPCVIYEFSLGGWVYVGRHYLRAGHHLANWPEVGTGRLPDGYEGSGIQPWGPIKAKYGIENAAWVIIEALEGVPHSVVRAAEEDAIAGAKAIFGRQCANRRDSDGLTPDEARALAERKNTAPEYAEFRARNAAQLAERNADPEFRANRAARLERLHAALWADPAYRAKNAAMLVERNAALWADAAFRQRNAEANRIKTQTPEVIAKRAESCRKSANQVTAPWKVVTVLLPESKGGKSVGQAVLPFCRTGMTVAQVVAACAAAGVSGPRNPADKSDTFARSGLRNLQRAGVISIDEPEASVAMAAE